MRLLLTSTSIKTYSSGYFRKQQNETGYFCGMTLNRFVLWIIVIPNLKEFSDSKFRFWLNVELNTLYNLKDIVHLTNVLSLLLLVDKVHEGSFGSSIKTVSRNRVPGSSFTWSTTFRTSSILFTNLPPIIARKSPCSMRFKF